MKIVLIKDIPGIGRKGEVKNVSDGYALNFLIPRKLAELGTAHAVAHAERVRADEQAARKIQEDLLLKNLSSLEGVSLVVSGKASDKGSLFAGIHKEQIIAELKKQKGLDILPDCMDLPHPIKEVGEHRITVKVQDKSVSFSLVVRAA